LFIIYCN